MKIIVFGGGGFIGSAVIDQLLKEGHSIRVFERPRVPAYRDFTPNEHVQWMTGDFSSNHDVKAAIEGMDAVMHLVHTTLPKSSNEDPIYDIQSNVVATVQLLNAMVACQVKRIIFISSGGTVYGRPQYTPIDEKHPTNPLVSYGITKLAIEKYLQMYQELHGIKTITLRVANPYGERQRIETAQGAVGVFLHRAINNLPIEIWGDGSVTRDYIHVSDVASAFVKALSYQGDENTFNVGSGSGVTLNELIEKIELVLNRKLKVNYLNSRGFDVPISVLCNKLLKKEFNWDVFTDLTFGLSTIVNSKFKTL